MAFAAATASSMASYPKIGSTGPNCSSVANAESGARSVTTVGKHEVPTRVGVLIADPSRGAYRRPLCRSTFDEHINPVAPRGGVQRAQRHLGSEAVADHLPLAPREHRLGQLVDAIPRRVEPLDRHADLPARGVRRRHQLLDQLVADRDVGRDDRRVVAPSSSNNGVRRVRRPPSRRGRPPAHPSAR